jgi:hypothetical protein
MIRIGVRSFVAGGGAAPYVGLLDTYTDAAVAYSVRLLRSAYTGSAIRVRRSSDNTEQDIGFDVSGNLDESALTTFVGANNGFVTTWYDQGGNGRNVTQSTAANQPQIVSSGSIIKKGNKPCLQLDGTNDLLQRLSVTISSGVYSGFAVSSNNLLNTSGVVFALSNANTNTLRVFCSTLITPTRHLVITNTSGVNYFANLSTLRNDTNQRLLSSFLNATNNMSGFDNGATGSTDTFSGTITNDALIIGAQSVAGVLSTRLNGTMQEIIAYNNDKSTSRINIESNINNYYGIY